MRNISELIGIIRGIDFGGIINKKEINRLELWVNQNRNLVYDPKENAIIQLLTKFLENDELDEKERKTLLDYFEEIQKKSADNECMMYELTGIIEGIACDKAINDSEVSRLKSWMLNDKNMIHEGKLSAQIYCKIKAIVDDGIITKKEQEQILKLLSEKRQKVQFDSKLESLKSKVKARKNIGVELIEILDNSEIIQEIHRCAEIELIEILNSYIEINSKEQELIFISLVLIAMLYDGNYYEHVRSTYKKIYQEFSEQRIEGLIREVIRRFGREKKGMSDRVRIINTVLSNAIVPVPFLSSFFDFIYDIYKLNLGYSISEDVYKDFEFVYEGLKHVMASGTDDVNIKAAKKTYKLIESTRRLIDDSENMDALIKLSIIIVKLIDKSIWGPNPVIYNPYLKQGYEKWLESYLNSDGKGFDKSENGMRTRWVPFYRLRENKIYLTPPIHNVKDEYDYHSFKILVKNGETEVYTNLKPDVREIFGGYQITIPEIKITAPLGKISYLFLVGDKVVYDSKKSLFREIIVFDQNGLEIKNNTDFSGTALFVLPSDDTELETIHREANYIVAYKNVKKGEVCTIGGIVFNFFALLKPGIFGEKYSNHFLEKAETKKKIEVFEEIYYLMFECEKQCSQIDVLIDRKNFDLKDLEYQEFENEGIMRYIIPMSNFVDGLHNIKVYTRCKEDKRKIVDKDFAIDTKLVVESLKLDDQRYLISVDSKLLNSDIVEEINLKDFREDWLKLKICEMEYSYRLAFDLDLYRIGESPWQSMTEEIWTEDIHADSVLRIYNCDADQMWVFSRGRLIEKCFLEEDGHSKKTPIGFLRTFRKESKRLDLLLLKEEKVIKEKGLICYNHVILDEQGTELIYDCYSKKLRVNPKFKGRGNVFFTINNSQGKEIYRSKCLKKDEEVISPELPSFEKLSIIFYEKEKRLSLGKEMVLKEYEATYYAMEDLVGHSFRIKNVWFEKMENGEFLKKKYFLDHTFVLFEKRQSNNLFQGCIYAKTATGIYRHKNINPIDIEICSSLLEQYVEITMKKEGDGLLLDTKHRGIMNVLEDKCATDIYSYIINLEEKGEDDVKQIESY